MTKLQKPIKGSTPIGLIISLTIFSVALWLVYDTLQTFRLSDVVDHFLQHSLSSVMLAAVITVASYFIVTGYDVVALIHIKRVLPYNCTALTAFLASVFGNNLGFAILTGTSVRYRMYSQAGLSGYEITGISSMCALTTMLGMAMIFGSSMTFGSTELTQVAFSIPPAIRIWAGALVMAVILGYVCLVAIRPVKIKIKNLSIPCPNAKILLAQIGLATLNLSLVGSIIYVLISPFNIHGDYMSFLGVFSIAVIAGSASNVPGGIGVFESVLLLGLPAVPPEALLGCILLFRCIYYMLPLMIATSLLFYKEFSENRRQIQTAQNRG